MHRIFRSDGPHWAARRCSLGLTAMAEKEVTRVVATLAAEALIGTLRAAHGPVIFHQSGGCCDGSAPMCFPVTEFMVGTSDVKLGTIAGVPFYMSESQFEYWQHTQLIIDVVPSTAGTLSLDRPPGLRCRARARHFDAVPAVRPQTHH